jgi:eukaryotic-like serine/threonine-protein kinase
MADDSSERFVLLNHLADEFAARYRRGEHPSMQEYIDRHPQLADDIREYFPALAEMEQVNDDRQTPEEQAACRALPPLERLGDFRIIREIGRGGMGVVYEAEQVSLGRHVALKVLPKQLLVDARTKQRFEREARAAANLHHTNIVPVFGVGEHDGLPYYVMQFIQGLGLDEVLVELKRLQPCKPGSGSAPGLTGGELRVSRKDVSAAAVARSLLTGHFTPAAEKAVGQDADPAAPTQDRHPAPQGDAPAYQSDTTAVHAPGAVADGAPPLEAPVAGRLSDTYSLSSSSVVLPGTGRQFGKKQLTYWQSVAMIGVQVADALEHAHRQGIQHRDIKPSNLILDTTGTVWVTDFGLAKANDQLNLTHTGDVLGTLRYMPPEAFDGKTDARSDVYSLGLTLYELLAFRPAFDQKERNPLIKQVTTSEPARLDRLNRDVPRDLVTIVHKAIERGPAHRYATASDLAADLQRFLDDEPIHARRQTLLEHSVRWARQHKPLAASLLTLALVLVTVAVGSTIAAMKYQRVAQEKSQLAEQAIELAGQREEQRQRAEASRQEHQRVSAGLMMERGISFCEQEQLGRGLLWLARGLELVPPEDVALEQSFRTLLGGWGRRLPTQRVILQFRASVESAAVSPDGQTVLVGCADGTAWIWQMDSEAVLSPKGELVLSPVLGEPRPLPVGHRGPVRHVAFSPDGRTIVTGSRDGTIELRTTEGKAVGQPLRHQGPVRHLLFSPDGKTLASASNDHTARLWNVVSATPACEPLRHKAEVRTLAFSPDGARLITGGDDAARLWHVASGQPVGDVLPHQASVRAVAFSPDGLMVLTAGNDCTARLWDACTGRAKGATVRLSEPIAAVAFTPDGKRFVTACEDHNLHIWHTATLQAARAPLAHKDEVMAVSFSPDGCTLLTGCADRTARLWDVASGRPLGDPMRNHGSLHVVAFSPDARWVITAGHDHTVRLWETPAGNRPFRRLETMGKAVLAVAFSPDGQTLFVGSEQGQHHDRVSGRLLGVVSQPGHVIGAAAYSPDSKTIATGSFDSTARLWDVKTGQPRGEPLQHLQSSWVLGVAFSPDGQTLLTGSGNYDTKSRRGDGQLWDVATGQLRCRLLGHKREVTAVAFRPDGKSVATASRDGTVRFWESATGRPTGRELRLRDWVVALAYSPDGRKIVTGARDLTARVWDEATREQILASLEHPKEVNAVAFSPDGRLILTGCADGAARLWDALTGRLVDAPLWHEAPVLTVAFSPDGGSILTGTQDGFAYLTAAPIFWTGSPRATRHWVRVNANQKLDPSGDSRPLELTEWQQEVRQLVEENRADDHQ